MCRHFVSLKIAYILSYGKRKDRMSGDFLKKVVLCPARRLLFRLADMERQTQLPAISPPKKLFPDSFPFSGRWL